MDTTNPLSTQLRTAREDAGLSIEDVAFLARKHLPTPMRFSRAKLQRMETTAEEGSLDPYVIQFLAHLYGKDLADISPAAARQLAEYAALLQDEPQNWKIRGRVDMDLTQHPPATMLAHVGN